MLNQPLWYDHILRIVSTMAFDHFPICFRYYLQFFLIIKIVEHLETYFSSLIAARHGTHASINWWPFYICILFNLLFSVPVENDASKWYIRVLNVPLHLAATVYASHKSYSIFFAIVYQNKIKKKKEMVWMCRETKAHFKNCLAIHSLAFCNRILRVFYYCCR